jgi:hypothetical protein
VVALRPTLTAPARGAERKPGRDGGAVTSDRTKELDEEKKERLELDAGDRITEAGVTRMGGNRVSGFRRAAVFGRAIARDPSPKGEGAAQIREKDRKSNVILFPDGRRRTSRR